jgi:hypothetical protein
LTSPLFFIALFCFAIVLFCSPSLLFLMPSYHIIFFSFLSSYTHFFLSLPYYLIINTFTFTNLSCNILGPFCSAFIGYIGVVPKSFFTIFENLFGLCVCVLLLLMLLLLWSSLSPLSGIGELRYQQMADH